MKNDYRDGMMGLVVGDALGCPVQFLRRTEIERRGPVTGMEGHGTYDMPAGTWTDDSSMALAALASMAETGAVDPDDIMKRFVAWDREGEYTPFGYAFDQGGTCTEAIRNYMRTGDAASCGPRGEYSNGNGSLMRILPVCIAACHLQEKGGLDDKRAVGLVDSASALTHAHPRAKMACGIYWFMVREILREVMVSETGLRKADSESKETLVSCLQKGIDAAMNFYKEAGEWRHYRRLENLTAFGELGAEAIRGTGYVVESLEAAVWGLITSPDYRTALLKIVNLGDDTDSVAAIAGGLGGLYYGYDAIPAEWREVIVRREWIEELCKKGI